jgi:radical SAM superfamily enzyme YgiQ (UPF0313 family)
MKPHILLINPWIYDFSAYNLWYKPLGLLYLASILRINGLDVSFIDLLEDDPFMVNENSVQMGKKKSDEDGSYARQKIQRPSPLKNIPRNFYRFGITPNLLQKRLKALDKPDVVMITSMMTYWYPGLFDTISVVKGVYPNVPVVIGGNYVTLCPEHASTSGADFLLPGAGEISMPVLLKNLLQMDMALLPDPNNLDSYPYPAFDLLRHPRSLPILTSRGCPYRCSYCASHLLHPSFQRRDPIHVVDEIEFWHLRYGVTHFSFYDDAMLVGSSEMAAPLFKEIIRRNLPLKFHCPNGLHLREVNDEMANLMHQAGFKTIRFGFETSNLIRQKQTGGKVNNEEFVKAVENLKNAGYSRCDIGIYLLCGLPGQPAAEIADSIRYVQSVGAHPILTEYSPIPGTGLWPDAIASSAYPIADEPLFQNNTLLSCRSESLTIGIYHQLKLMARCNKMDGEGLDRAF